MNKKQQTFADEYLLDLNGKQAAIRAGYSPKTAESQASRLLTNAKVAEYIAKAQQERSKRLQIDADWIVEKLVGNHARAMELDELGHSNKAIELLGKTNGAFVDKMEIDQAITINIIRPDRGTNADND